MSPHVRAAQIYDAIIIGGGAAGLSAALLLGRACRRIIVVDDGRPRNAVAAEMHGYLTRDGVNPLTLLSMGQRELAKYGVETVKDLVVHAEPRFSSGQEALKTLFQVLTRDGRELLSRKILLATGTVDELPDVEGMRQCYGVSVHHGPYCDGWEHRNQHLLAYGETVEKAVGLGLALQTWSRRVTVLTNGLPTSAHDQRRLTGLEIALNEERVLRLVHSHAQLQGVELEESGLLAADALFFNTRQRPRSELPCLLGCQVNESGLAHTHEKQKTDVPGVFLAGDADGDVQFVIVAAAEGATAAVAINRELQEEDIQQRQAALSLRAH
jgi:thioredoxin reductase